MWRGLVVGALVISLAANIYLLSTRSGDSAARVEAPATASSSRRSAVVRAVPPQIASAERAALQVRLAAAEKKLEEVLPANAMFDRASEPAPEAEARLRPHLERLFGGDFSVECRERFCRIRGPKDDPMKTLEIQHDMKLVRNFRGKAVIGPTAYLELAEDDRTAALDAVLEPVYALLGSRELADCKRDHPSTGTLAMTIRIDARRYVVGARGPLAEQAIGTCIRRALEAIAAKTTIPDDVTSSDEVPFPVPVE